MSTQVCITLDPNGDPRSFKLEDAFLAMRIEMPKLYWDISGVCRDELTWEFLDAHIAEVGRLLKDIGSKRKEWTLKTKKPSCEGRAYINRMIQIADAMFVFLSDFNEALLLKRRFTRTQKTRKTASFLNKAMMCVVMMSLTLVVGWDVRQGVAETSSFALFVSESLQGNLPLSPLAFYSIIGWFAVGVLSIIQSSVLGSKDE